MNLSTALNVAIAWLDGKSDQKILEEYPELNEVQEAYGEIRNLKARLQLAAEGATERFVHKLLLEIMKEEQRQPIPAAFSEKRHLAETYLRGKNDVIALLEREALVYAPEENLNADPTV